MMDFSLGIQRKSSEVTDCKLEEIVMNAFLTSGDPSSARTSRRVCSPSGDLGLQQYIRDCNKYGAIPVNYFMRHVHADKLEMKHYGLGPLGAKALARPLELNTNIREVDLEGNSIGPRGALYLASSLRENVYITHLNIADNNLRTYGASAIIEMMRENTTIRSLNISGNELSDRDGRIFFYLLKHNHNLRTLSICHNKLAGITADWLVQAFDINDTLHVLDLSWNHIRKQAAVDLANMLMDNGSLRELYLSMNGLGCEGASAMGHVLEENNVLEVLDISANRITDNGTSCIAKALATNTTLRELYMGKNPLSPEGAMILLQGIENNSSSALEMFNIQGVDVSAEFERLETSLIKDRGIKIIRGRVLKKRKKFRARTPAAPAEEEDINVKYLNDPLTKLRKYCMKRKIRLLDLFKQFDKDQSWSVSVSELTQGILSTGIDMDEKELDLLISKLDKDGDGDIDYKELAIGDKTNLQDRLKVAKHNREQAKKVKEHQKKQEEEMAQKQEEKKQDESATE